MTQPADADHFYVIGSSPVYGHGPIIIALDHIEILIIYIPHAPHTLYLFSKLIYFLMVQAQTWTNYM